MVSGRRGSVASGSGCSRSKGEGRVYIWSDGQTGVDDRLGSSAWRKYMPLKFVVTDFGERKREKDK